MVMILAAGHHAMNNEANVIPIPLCLGAVAAFVVWGRWKKAPIAARFQ
jgi:putative oxidoreductase